MKRQLVLVTVVLALFLALAGILAGGGQANVSGQSGMPVPGMDGVQETIVEDGEEGAVNLDMPVPGSEGVPEMIVNEEETGVSSSGMPVPGLTGVEESIVTEE